MRFKAQGVMDTKPGCRAAPMERHEYFLRSNLQRHKQGPPALVRCAGSRLGISFFRFSVQGFWLLRV